MFILIRTLFHTEEMMSDTVLITGTGRGLGYSLAGEYLKKGNTVYGLNKSDTPEMKFLAKEYSGRFHPVKCDITSEKAVSKAARKILEETTAIDLLINNAGIHREKPFTDTNEFDAKIVRDTFEVNAIGPFLITKYFHEAVTRGKRKVFVNISSEAGSIGTCWRDREYGYCMSKAALNMLSVILQNKLKPFGVKVLAIHPGWMRTVMGGADADLDPGKAAEDIVSAIEKNSGFDTPVYIDHTGKPMQW